MENATNNLYDDHKIYVTSPYGELPNDIMGVDNTHYRVKNRYCFNFSGQGVKIETIFQMGPLEQTFGESRAIEAVERFKIVDFVPSEEHSRVVPLTPEDYQKINNMFEQIDKGLYQYKV